MADNIENTLKMPASVAQAIVGVMSKVKKLEKSNENKFDKYDFTSIDDFMEFMNPILSEEGLIILQSEAEDPELLERQGSNNKTILMLKCRYDFMLCSKDGDLYGPLKRSVMVQATGAQAYGSAQSYALKQLERSLFQIPTGDKDDPDNSTTAAIGEPPTLDLKKMAGSIKRAINAAGNPEALAAVSIKYSDDLLLIEGASKSAHDHLMAEIDKKSKLLVNQMGQQ